MGMKQTKSIEELYPIIEEGDGDPFPRDEKSKEPKPPLIKPVALKSRRSKSNPKPATLEALQNTEIRPLLNLRDLCLALLAKKNLIGLKMAPEVISLIELHEARNELVAFASYPQRLKAAKRRTKTTKEELLKHKQDFIKRYKTEHGWLAAAKRKFGIKDGRTIEKLME
jgi:hypothetical protein